MTIIIFSDEIVHCVYMLVLLTQEYHQLLREHDGRITKKDFTFYLYFRLCVLLLFS